MADEESTETETDLSLDKTYGDSTTTQFAAYKDLPDLPGDIKLAADGGASLLVGQEGLIILKASPLAQLVLGGLMNFARIVSREFEVVGDFGSIRMTNGSSGRCGLVIEGGGSYGDESEPGAEHQHAGS